MYAGVACMRGECCVLRAMRAHSISCAGSVRCVLGDALCVSECIHR